MKQKYLLFICTIIGIIFLLFSACAEPNPLYGTWADNYGNTISFFEDGLFNVAVNAIIGKRNYEGNYSVLMNSLTFNCTNEELTMVTEWDIRGNMLYLDWLLKDEGLKHLTLFKIAN